MAAVQNDMVSLNCTEWCSLHPLADAFVVVKAASGKDLARLDHTE